MPPDRNLRQLVEHAYDGERDHQRDLLPPTERAAHGPVPCQKRRQAGVGAEVHQLVVFVELQNLLRGLRQVRADEHRQPIAGH